jgi:ADP-ribose pyrophosphatase YjhB (NUDIX family)
MDFLKNQPCPSCNRFANRGVSVDAVIVRDNKVLLIQRGVEPDKGSWGVPGGYVGWDESTEDAVKREVKEETNLDVDNIKLVGIYSDPKRHPKQVINIVYLVRANGELEHGDDAENAKWVLLDELPEQMALDHRQSIEDARRLL